MTAPFVLLTLPASMLVWARVYFYGILGVASGFAFFASPGKAWLSRRLKARNQIAHKASQATTAVAAQQAPLLGLPEDPARDVDEAIREIREEVETRQRRGSKLEMPSGDQLKRAIEEKTGKKFMM